MELRVLRYFLMVAREENITRAANLLHVTQPTLSRQLMLLEEELGVQLFKRSRHSVVLTNDGMLLKRRAQEMVALAEKTEQEFASRDDVLSGEIAIGCGETHNMEFLSEQIALFREKHPLVRFFIYSANVDDIKDRIEKGILDIGLLLEPVEFSKYEAIQMPMQERWGVLTRKDSVLASRKVINPKDLHGVPLIVSRRERVMHSISHWFGEGFDHMEIAATYNLILNATVMVKKKVGVALCFDFDSMWEDLCFIPLSPKLEVGAVLVWKKHQVTSPATAQFIQHIKKSFFAHNY